MPSTLFSPAKHGFRFANFFENVIFEESPFGRVATRGRCGGMAFTALDHFYAGLPVPGFTPAQLAPGHVPPDAHPLARYIYKRQIDSFLVLSAVKYITWSLSPDDASFLVKGVTRWTKQDEFAKLRASIDSGKPVTLGLIVARDLAGLGQNHQVIAYGYDYAPVKDAMTVNIYDVNYPDRELTLTSDKFRSGWIESSPTQENWRGWFVQDYAPNQPPANLTQPLPPRPVQPGSRSAQPRQPRMSRLVVSLDRVIFHNPEEPEMFADMVLEFNIEGEQWRYPGKGARRVKHGTRIRLDKQFDVAVPKDGTLNIHARLSPSISTTNTPKFDAFEFFNLDNDHRAGTITVSYGAADKWGNGKHSVRSSGEVGGYTLEFSIGAA
jgi:hypothetical protein